MADVVNLNKFRKKKAKAEKEKRAETNRRLHGRTKAERLREETAKKKLDATVRGAFLERDKAPPADDHGIVDDTPSADDDAPPSDND